jgi:Histidine phosphatase superfamily (branch 1)
MAEINPGVWDGLSPDQARKYYPEEWDRFVRDPYAFRAPRAESYHDLSSNKIIIFFSLDLTNVSSSFGTNFDRTREGEGGSSDYWALFCYQMLAGILDWTSCLGDSGNRSCPW